MSADIDTGAFRWTSASRSHPGRIRRNNEDACLDRAEHGLWAVADGMGGHILGEFASGLAVQSLTNLPHLERVAHESSDRAASGDRAVSDDRAVSEGISSGEGIPSGERSPSGAGLEQRVALALSLLQDVNRKLRLEAVRREVAIIGTTVAALVAAGNRCSCLWAGDSRIYLYRARRLRQLTRDHSQREAARSRRIPANLITRALGAEDTLCIDRLNLDLLDGDIFLLCTDGLSNEVSAPSMEQALLSGICSVACDALVDMALDRQARDNVTAVVVRAEDLRSPERTLLRAL